MSLGWARVPLEQWEKLREGQQGAIVQPGTYLVEAQSIRHLQPQGDKFGVYFLGLKITEENNPEWAGKRIDMKFQYHPNPVSENYETMNRISQQLAQRTFDAAGVELISDGQNVDIPATFNSLVQAKARFLVDVSHREVDGKTYQDAGNPKQLVI